MERGILVTKGGMEMNFPKLETSRLNLIQVLNQYAENLYDIFSRDEVTKYYGMDSMKSVQEAHLLIEHFYKIYENKRGIRWGIILKENGELIGTIGLNNLNIGSKRAEIGYELHPAYWNKGFITEAVKEVLNYSFNELQLFRVGAVTYPQNRASIQLLKKMGFSKEGLLRGYLYQNHLSHDVIIFSLLKTEWQE